MTSATVRIPGTTANLGSGFDTLGLAVALYNRATVRRRSDRRIEITSPIAEDARAGALAMLEEAAAELAADADAAADPQAGEETAE
jgi:homoserine kinase